MMLGNKAIQKSVTKAIYEAQGIAKQSSGQFMVVAPNNVKITDLLFYKVGASGETNARAQIFYNNGGDKKTYNHLKSNDLQPINLTLTTGGMLQVIIIGAAATKINIFYKLL